VRVHTQETILEEPPSDLEEFPQLSEAIAGVKQAREEREEQEEFKAPYQDVVPLPAYQAEDDEVHNLHTYWSVVRLRFREPLAELLAVCLFPCHVLVMPLI
jgi:aquaglyceroporin related protein